MTTAGEEALELGTGGCLQSLDHFLSPVKSHPTKNVTIEADECALRRFTSAGSVSGYTNGVKPPADFVIGKATDTWASGANR